MIEFMDRDFLLHSETAKMLFHGYAEKCPIYDYHNHLSAKDIFQRRRFDDLCQLWLENDHYKWRCMRACGIDEEHISGSVGNYEKFLALAEITPKLIGNPVYHWIHLELRRFFGITTPLDPGSAEYIWKKSKKLLSEDGFDTVSLLRRANVAALCTTDDPADDLEWHIKIANDSSIGFQVLPSFRPDRFLDIASPGFIPACGELGRRYGEIKDWDSLIRALTKSLEHFVSAGCRVSDHSFSDFRYLSADIPDTIVKKALDGSKLSQNETEHYQSALMLALAGKYHEQGIAMQLHLGALRNNSPFLFSRIGPDAGADSIGESISITMLGRFLHDLELANKLPKTILYNLNPADSSAFATMAVNFCSNKAGVQYGAAWWMLDTLRGISSQLRLLMETGLISGSIGMLTDSRSVTGMVRHEYFRRILCNHLGDIVQRGEYPNDMESLGRMVEDICFKNAENYFNL